MESDDEDLLSSEAYAHCKDDVGFDSSQSPGLDGSLPSSQDGSLVPRPAPWPRTWELLVHAIRRDARPKVWEILSGTFGLTQAFADAGWPVAPPYDVVFDTSFVLQNPLFIAFVVRRIDEGRVQVLHIGPPRSSFSIALNSARASAVRSVDEPAGLYNIPECKKDKVRLGNDLADATVILASAQALRAYADNLSSRNGRPCWITPLSKP